MKSITWFGAILALLGLIGLAIPVFTTSRTEDVAKLGDFKVQSTEQSTHVIPQVLSGGAIVLGIILIGAGTSKSADSRKHSRWTAQGSTAYCLFSLASLSAPCRCFTTS